MNIVTLITAKGNSIRVKNKNMKKLNGVPLIDYTINAALKSVINNNYLFVSSESAIIQKHVIKKKINFIKRPQRLSSKFATSEDVILHSLKNINHEKHDYLMILQPTSPFRSHKNINDFLVYAKKNYNKFDCLLSSYVNPNDMWKEKNSYLIRIQKNAPRNTFQRKPFIEENSAIYLINIRNFLKTNKISSGRVMHFPISKLNSIDINDMEDFKLAEKILK
tara:strand:- start:1354 stop:2016 length:663 start_codon:yes stop_codon:yes gene_type:complete